MDDICIRWQGWLNVHKAITKLKPRLIKVELNDYVAYKYKGEK